MILFTKCAILGPETPTKPLLRQVLQRQDEQSAEIRDLRAQLTKLTGIFFSENMQKIF